MRHCTTLLKIQLFCICCILFIRYFCKSIKKAINSNWQYSFYITDADYRAQSHCSPGLRIHYKKEPIVTIRTFHTTVSSFPNISSYKKHWFLTFVVKPQLRTLSTACASLWPLLVVILPRLLPSPAWQLQQALLALQLRLQPTDSCWPSPEVIREIPAPEFLVSQLQAAELVLSGRSPGQTEDICLGSALGFTRVPTCLMGKTFCTLNIEKRRSVDMTYIFYVQKGYYLECDGASASQHVWT